METSTGQADGTEQTGSDDGDGFDRQRALTFLSGVVLVNVVGAAPAILAGPDSAWFRGLILPAVSL